MLTEIELNILMLLADAKDALTQKEATSRIVISVDSVNKIVTGLTDRRCCSGKITYQGREVLELYKVKCAIFLAVGFGQRLVLITFSTPKLRIRVHRTLMCLKLICFVRTRKLSEHINMRQISLEYVSLELIIVVL